MFKSIRMYILYNIQYKVTILYLINSILLLLIIVCKVKV